MPEGPAGAVARQGPVPHEGHGGADSLDGAASPAAGLPGGDAPDGAPRRRVHPLWWGLGAPVAVLLVVAAIAWFPTTGDEALLQTRPVDPPDLFRGDYVTLSYDISDVQAVDAPERGARVYVRLEPDGAAERGTGDPYWTVAEWSTRPLDGFCLRGTVTGHSGSSMRIEYGIEQYFIPKDETLEDWRGKEVSVVVTARDCTARVKEIHLDGETWRP